MAGCRSSLIDTAGLREAARQVEAEGIKRALARAEDADLVLWVVDALAPQWDPPFCRKSAAKCKPAQIAVLNKIDLAPSVTGGDLQVSAKTGAGLEALVTLLSDQAQEALGLGEGSGVVTRARHRVELEGAVAALERFREETGARSSRPRSCASPPAISAASPAASTWRRCWAPSSPSSASANDSLRETL